MRNELSGTTAIADGVVGVPGSQPDDTSPASTGPPNTNDYWHGLIDEKTAADFMDLTPRWLQAKRQHGDGPKFIRISQRCIRYTRYWLKTYADDRLRSSTSDHGEATAA